MSEHTANPPTPAQRLQAAALQRIVAAPIPDVAMRELTAKGKAHVLADFTGAPIRYASRWWRPDEGQWYALDEAGSALIDAQADRWRAAHAAGVPATHSEPNPTSNVTTDQAAGES
ncbi:hypothetical protein ABZ023_26085 [Streptomyces sp. NPDC006367]|uniref:hypothetical protein n=1 Tax=unclassified Streptomyces TaxID=2593676 RepID=UPI0033AB6C2E